MAQELARTGGKGSGVGGLDSRSPSLHGGNPPIRTLTEVSGDQLRRAAPDEFWGVDSVDEVQESIAGSRNLLIVGATAFANVLLLGYLGEVFFGQERFGVALVQGTVALLFLGGVVAATLQRQGREFLHEIRGWGATSAIWWGLAIVCLIASTLFSAAGGEIALSWGIIAAGIASALGLFTLGLLQRLLEVCLYALPLSKLRGADHAEERRYRRVKPETPEAGQLLSGEGDWAQWVDEVAAGDIVPGNVLLLTTGDVVSWECSVVAGTMEVSDRNPTGRTVRRLRVEGSPVHKHSVVCEGRAIVVIENVQPSEDVILTRGNLVREQLSHSFSWGGQAQGKLVLRTTLAALVVASVGVLSPFTMQFRIADSLLALASAAVGALFLFPELVLRAAWSRKAQLLFGMGVMAPTVSALRAVARVKRVLFYIPDSGDERELRVAARELLDSRLDEGRLWQVVRAVFTQADFPEAYACDRAFGGGSAALAETSIAVRGIDRGRGIVADVSGLTVLVGIEAFVVQHGAVVDPSESVSLSQNSEGSATWLVAIHGEIVATLTIKAGTENRSAKLLPALRASGLRLFLLGTAPRHEFEALGKELGFEPAEMKGNISADRVHTVVSEASGVPYALVSNVELPRDKERLDSVIVYAGEAAAGPASSGSWQESHAFHSEASAVESFSFLWKGGRRLALLEDISVVIGWVVFLSLGVLSLKVTLSPLVVLTAVIVFQLILVGIGWLAVGLGTERGAAAAGE